MHSQIVRRAAEWEKNQLLRLPAQQRSSVQYAQQSLDLDHDARL